MRRLFYLWGFLSVLVPALACGPAASLQVTPTPTKTPRLIRTVEPLSSATSAQIIGPTNTVAPQVPPTDTPAPLPTDPPAQPPTDTPTPEPPPTDTPPPPPTNTPAPPPPPPPTNTPAPPPPTQPPAPTGPQVIIDLPDGDTFGLADDVRVVITVRDSDGVGSFTWGIFAQNGSPLGLGGDHNCGGVTECGTNEEFETKLTGQFFVGVDAVDSKGNKTREIKQLYVG
jgi:hypothetical protein